MTDGGGRGRFATTHWSLVLAAQGRASSPEAHQALSTLCETYWYPLYAFVRGRGYSVEDAQDLTQEFFGRLLEKHTLQHADPARGRFRSFLLASFKNFVANERDRRTAAKRGGGATLVSFEIEGAEGRFQREPPDDETPERIFDRRWALAVLERVMARLRDEMEARSGKPSSFDRLKNYLTGDDPHVSYARTAGELGMSEGAVKVSVHRLRRRFADLMRDEIARTVASPEDIEDELRHLRASLTPQS